MAPASNVICTKSPHRIKEVASSRRVERDKRSATTDSARTATLTRCLQLTRSLASYQHVERSRWLMRNSMGKLSRVMASSWPMKNYTSPAQPHLKVRALDISYRKVKAVPEDQAPPCGRFISCMRRCCRRRRTTEKISPSSSSTEVTQLLFGGSHGDGNDPEEREPPISTGVPPRPYGPHEECRSAAGRSS